MKRLLRVCAGGDPARVAAQIVSGVGFLGAGTIIKSSEDKLMGLTTAASIWTAVWHAFYVAQLQFSGRIFRVA